MRTLRGLSPRPPDCNRRWPKTDLNYIEGMMKARREAGIVSTVGWEDAEVQLEDGSWVPLSSWDPEVAADVAVVGPPCAAPVGDEA